MNKLIPTYWIEVPLEEILYSLESGNRPKGGVKGILKGIPSIGGEHLNDTGGFNFTNTRFVPEDYYKKKILKGHITEKDILIVKDGATTGKVSFVDISFPFEKAVVNEHVFVLKTFGGLISKFFFYYLWSQEGNRRILENFQGSAQGGINRQFISNTLVPLPPFNEQKRIVAKLDAIIPRIDSVKARLEKIPIVIKRFRQSVLTAAVTGKLTERWREGHPEIETWADSLSILPNKLNDSYLNIFEETQHSDLPTTWIYAPLANLGRIQGGGTPSKSNLNFWEGNIPWISPKDMKIDKISNGRDFISKSALDNFSVKLLPEKSILFVVRGMILAHTFPVAITQNEVTINQDIKGLTPSQVINAEYLFLVFKSIQGNILSYVKEATHGTLRLEMTIIQTYAIPLPPLSEQKEIVRQVDRLFALADKLEVHYHKAKARIDKLSQSILAKAFRGELVSQDPNDEPAEKLLERIMAEKTKMEGGGRQKAKTIKRRAKV